MSATPFQPSLVPEDVFDRVLLSYQTCAKKKSWKYRLKTPDGSVVKLQRVGGLFVYWMANQKFAIMGEMSAQDRGLNWQHPGHEAFAAMVEENQTGNHASKPWHIRVPTKPSEPVRG